MIIQDDDEISVYHIVKNGRRYDRIRCTTVYASYQLLSYPDWLAKQYERHAKLRPSSAVVFVADGRAMFVYDPACLDLDWATLHDRQQHLGLKMGWRTLTSYEATFHPA